MTAQDCLNLLREIKSVAFATVSPDDKPQIRIIDVMLVEEHMIVFCTSRGKNFYAQLLAKKDVAVTGLTHDYKMLRLNGKAERLTDQKLWIDRIFLENPGMNEVYPGESRYALETFCIAKGQIEVFDLGVSPIQRESFVIGDAENELTGFVITDSCIGCGTCAGLCPQKAIQEGTPYRIAQSHCLHCGLCWENCPAGAVVRRGRQVDAT